MCVSFIKSMTQNKIFIWFLTVLWMLNACTISVYAKEEKEELQLYAKAAVLMDADSGRVLYGKNEKEILPMASTTKIMTCILALEYGDVDEIVTASGYAARMPKVKLNVQEGEHFRMGDLLYSLMLESHNDAAVVIAEAVGGSVEGFSRLMNQKARDLGCYDTYFITPNGLDAVVNETGKIHSTTATDLARIMAYCITESPAREEFLKITRTPSYQFTDADGKRNFQCNNHNAFLSMMQEAVSGKTGFTNNAGYCYVGAIESEGRVFTVALLACGWPNHKTYKWSDMKQLARYGMEHYEYRDIYQSQTFQDIRVKDSLSEGERSVFEEGYVKVRLEDNGEDSISCLLCEDDRIEVRAEVKKTLEAPVEAGEPVGRVSYYLNDTLIRQYEVLTQNGVERRTFASVLEFLTRRYLCALKVY